MRQFGGEFDRRRYPGCIGRAVGFYDSSVQPQKHAAVYAAGVYLFLQAAQRRVGQQRCKTRKWGKAEGLAQAVANKACRAFSGFDGDIAGEPVSYDDIANVARDITAFDEPDIVEPCRLCLRPD